LWPRPLPLTFGFLMGAGPWLLYGLVKGQTLDITWPVFLSLVGYGLMAWSEEALYRGLAVRLLSQIMGLYPSVVTAVALFTALHYSRPDFSIPLVYPVLQSYGPALYCALYCAHAASQILEP